MTINTKQDGGNITFTLSGELNTQTAPELSSEYSRFKSTAEHILLDMKNLSYITSAGLRVLLTMEQDMEDKGGSLVLTGVNEEVMEVFELTGFVNILDIR